jgi:PAS domain S-box-containing protein
VPVVFSAAALLLSKLTTALMHSPVLIYFILASVLAAWVSDTISGLLTLALGCLEASFFVLRPAQSIQVEHAGQLSRLGLLAGVALLVIYVLSRLKAAQQEVAHLASFPQLNPNPIAETDLEGKITYVNPVMLARFPDVVELQSRHPLLADWPAMVGRFGVAGRKPISREVRVGDSVIFQTIQKMPDQALVRFYSLDITELKQVEEALRESEKRYRLLFESIDEGFCLIEVMFDENGKPSDWRFLETNPAFEKHNGLHEAEGKTILELAPNIEKGWLEIYGRVAITGEAVRFVQRSEALGRWFDLYAFRVGEPEQRRVAVLFSNITSRMQTEAALRESEQRFRTLVENVPQMIWVAASETEFLYFSPNWLEYTGTTLEENAKGGWDAVHPEDLPATLEKWRVAVSTRKIFETEYRLRRADGEYRWHFARAVPTNHPDSNRTLWFGTTTDTQDQKHAQELLLRTEKLASVGRMAATVAHEINNPLAVVTNLIYIALMDSNLPDHVRKNLETAERELDRVAHLTRQTLGFYRENTAPMNVDIAALVTDVLDLYRPKLKDRKIRVEFEEGTADLQVYALAGEIRQVVSNIIANAIDACPLGGRVRVRIRRVFFNGRNSVRLSFADTGDGIPPENLARIFEPFYTTKQAVGTGLGLWVSSEIIQRHQGSIRVRSQIGRGSVFSIYLPLAAHPIQQEAA